MKGVRAFLGLASFYRRLVQKFAETAKPLTKLTRKGQEFHWDPSQQEEFDELKTKLCTTPVLAYPNFELPFILTTDASKVAVAAILLQVQNGLERPVTYASRQLKKAEQAYSASEAELLALVWAAKHFRCYLYGKRFTVRTDHAALTCLKTFSDTNEKLMRWSLKLSELDFIVEHRAGTKIPHLDALSRHVGTISSATQLSPKEILDQQRKDQFCKGLKPGSYSSRQEFFYDDEGLIQASEEQKASVACSQGISKEGDSRNHDPIYAAHPGVKRTCEVLTLSFWWPGMRKSVEEYINECDSCQQRKGSHEYKAPLGDPGNPTAPFEVTSMDITGPYPLTPRKNRYLLTFIDHFTKYAEIFPIEGQSALTCASVCLADCHAARQWVKINNGPGFGLCLHFLMKPARYWEYRGPGRLAITL